MRLFIVQHGDAVPKEIDPDRPLSDRGKADIRRLADWLSNNEVRLAEIWHSGKTRALESAEIFRPLLGSSDRILERKGLAPNDSPDEFLKQLMDSEDDILIASHLPFVARTVSQALTGDPDRQLVDFSPGSIAGIERNEDSSWRLFLFARPESF